MIIGGFQKLTLIDFPGKVASIIFTYGCLFRCPYCHNPELVLPESKGDEIPENTVLEYLKEKKGFIDGVVITGGEPTLHKDLGEFIRKIKNMGYVVKLDTNGVRPEVVSGFIKEGIIDYVAMDLKHTWEMYNKIARTKKDEDIENVRITFEILQSSGIPHEFRTTVLPGWHKEEDFFTIAGNLKPGETYYLQDINYNKTLDTTLDVKKRLDVQGITSRLQERYPELLIDVR